MRDVLADRIRASGFEPTYKGLKLFSPCYPSRCQQRFEPTYKGLKLDLTPFSQVRVWGFEPTYKGLKPCSTASPRFPLSAF